MSALISHIPTWANKKRVRHVLFVTDIRRSRSAPVLSYNDDSPRSLFFPTPLIHTAERYYYYTCIFFYFLSIFELPRVHFTIQVEFPFKYFVFSNARSGDVVPCVQTALCSDILCSVLASFCCVFIRAFGILCFVIMRSWSWQTLNRYFFLYGYLRSVTKCVHITIFVYIYIALCQKCDLFY